MIYPITTGPQTVTGAGPVTGVLNTSGMSGDFTLVMEVSALSAATGTPGAIIDVEDTANATPFSDTQVDWVEQFSGPLAAADPVKRSKRKYEIPNCRFGAANTEFRCNVLALEGGTPSLTVNAWLVQ